MKTTFTICLILVYLCSMATSSVALEPARQILMPKDTRSVRGLSWLPDSRRVVVSVVKKLQKVDNRIIAVVDVENGNVKIISEPNIKHSHPVCSPDGRTIAYIGPMGDHSTIWLMDITGENKRPIANVRCWHRPVWSPDSKRLVFTKGNNDIWAINADGSGLKQLTSGPGSRSRPKWSPDGNLLAFVANDEIWLMQADGSDQKVLTKIVSEPHNRPIGDWDDLYDWSPDGKQIVYAYRPIPTKGECVNHDGGIHPYQIWIVNIDGYGKYCLTPDDISCGHPIWVPGKRHILFESVYKWVVTATASTRASYPDRNIWILDLVDKRKKQLTNIGMMTEFAISLDDGKVGKTTLRLSGGIHEFTVSPDGRKLVFTTGLYLFLLEIR